MHDPHVVTWIERPDTMYFESLPEALAGAYGVVLAVPHADYVRLDADELLDLVDGSAFVVDAQNILTDAKAHVLRDAGKRVIGVGKGHWRAEGYHLLK